MPDFSPGTLIEFNRQVLLLQDEAFNLAFSLLGDEHPAAELTQRAFLSVYQQQVRGHNPSIRLPLLRCIIQLSSRYSAAPGNQRLPPLTGLPEPDCLVLFLVDCLGLSYTDASAVLHCSSRKLAVRLAQARRKFAACDRIKARERHD